MLVLLMLGMKCIFLLSKFDEMSDYPLHCQLLWKKRYTSIGVVADFGIGFFGNVCQKDAGGEAL